jgi:hypothetical protein
LPCWHTMRATVSCLDSGCSAQVLIAIWTNYYLQVWDYTGLGYTRYNARDVCKEYLGYVSREAAVIARSSFFSGWLITFFFVFALFRCVVENKVLCNSLLLRLQVCLFLWSLDDLDSDLDVNSDVWTRLILAHSMQMICFLV